MRRLRGATSSSALQIRSATFQPAPSLLAESPTRDPFIVDDHRCHQETTSKKLSRKSWATVEKVARGLAFSTASPNLYRVLVVFEAALGPEQRNGIGSQFLRELRENVAQPWLESWPELHLTAKRKSAMEKPAGDSAVRVYAPRRVCACVWGGGGSFGLSSLSFIPYLVRLRGV